MDNLTDYEDAGEKFTEVITTPEFEPTFKSRSTIQRWKVIADVLVMQWEGVTLVKDSVHEIIIENISANTVSIFFHPVYTLIDEDVQTILIGAGGSAHFYGVGANLTKTALTLALRVGSQDDRRV
jgi:hypothetical protein